MGKIVSFSCNCGFEGKVYDGDGAEAVGVSYYCKKCNWVHNILRPYDNFDLDTLELIKDPSDKLKMSCGEENLSLIDFADKPICPRCLKEKLSKKEIGRWD